MLLTRQRELLNRRKAINSVAKMQTISKMHEKNVQNDVHVEKVDTILSDVENVPFALRGATVKTILYWLFSVIAAAELSAAFFFYISSFEMPQAVAAVIAVVLAFFLHGLIHAQLTDTSKGMVFSKHRESKAMSSEVKMNIVLSIILLFFAAGCVFFLGKKGYTAFREMKYQTALLESKGKDAPKGLVLTADMLTSKKGKISMDKLEQATALQNATAKATDATVQAATTDKVNYDKSTANITDVVGSSAFILELILGLLAYAIATAKFAATFDEIAKRNTANLAQNGEKIAITANVTDAVIEKTLARKPIGFSDNLAKSNDGRVIIQGFKRDTSPQIEPTTASVTDAVMPENMRTCLHCDDAYIYKIHNQKYCCEECRIAAWQEKNGVALRKKVKA